MFKTKGAVLVLIWSFFGFTAFHSLHTSRFNVSNIQWQLGTVTIQRQHIVGVCFFLYPIFGWLADTKFGRYKVIKWSYIVVAVLSAIFSIVSIFQNSSSSSYVSKILLLWHIPIAIILGGVIANIGQLGIDQLYDASSSEIASFVLWWTWVWILSGVVAALGQSCFCKLPALASLFLPASVTLAVCFDFLFNFCLIKESPPTSSPFTNIYKVLCYAVHHKYPMRSAPTDWDERHSARLDVGKSEYGGPFTNEEVEDVKTLLRIIAVLIAGMIFVGPYFPLDSIFYDITTALYYNTNHSLKCDESLSCFSRLAVVNSGDLVIVFAIPLFQFILCPVFRLRLSISILKRCFIGMLLAILSVLSTIFIVLAAAQKTSHNLQKEMCFIEFQTESKSSLDYRWMAVPYSLRTTVQLMLLTSGAHFILAQSPYSLKGFLFGLAYGLIGLSAIFGYGFSFGLQSITKRWLYHPYGCTFWYLVLALSVFLILILASLISFKCYKRRQREDQHELLFAVDHYP